MGVWFSLGGERHFPPDIRSFEMSEAEDDGRYTSEDDESFLHDFLYPAMVFIKYRMTKIAKGDRNFMEKFQSCLILK